RLRAGRVALQFLQPAAQDGGLLAQLGAEQLQQRVVFGVAHRSLARRASNNRASSRSPTSRPSQGNTPRDRCAAARPTVAGGEPTATRGTRNPWPTASTGNPQRSASRWTTSSRSPVAGFASSSADRESEAPAEPRSPVAFAVMRRTPRPSRSDRRRVRSPSLEGSATREPVPSASPVALAPRAVRDSMPSNRAR